MPPTDQQIAAHLNSIFVEASRRNADTIVFKVDSPPLADGFQQIGQTDVDGPAIAIIAKYMRRRNGCLHAGGETWWLQTCSSERLELRLERPSKPTLESDPVQKPNDFFQINTPSPGDPADANATESDAVLQKLVQCIIHSAIASNATAIRIEPSEDRVLVSFMVNGKWVEEDRSNNRRILNALLYQIGEMSGLTNDPRKAGSLCVKSKGETYFFSVCFSSGNTPASVTLQVNDRSTPPASSQTKTFDSCITRLKTASTQLQENSNGDDSGQTSWTKLQLASVCVVAVVALLKLLAMIPGNTENFKQSFEEQILEPTMERLADYHLSPNNPALSRPATKVAASSLNTAQPKSTPPPADGSDQSPAHSPATSTEKDVIENFKRSAQTYMQKIRTAYRQMPIEITAGNEYAKGTNSIRQGEREIARITGKRVPNLNQELFYRLVGYMEVSDDYSIDWKKNDSLTSPYLGTIRTRQLFVPTEVVECEPPSMRTLVLTNHQKYEKWEPLVIECRYQDGKWRLGKNLKQSFQAKGY